MTVKKLFLNIRRSIEGREIDFSAEHRFFNSILFGGSVIAIYGILYNLIAQVGLLLSITTIVTSLIVIFFYILSRIFKKYRIPRLIISYLLPVLLSFVWFQNGGTKGPIIYIFFVYFSFVLIEWDGLNRTILLIFLGLDLSLLYLLEYLYPSMVASYSNDISRMADLYSGVFLYFGLAGIIILYAKQKYIRERKKAEQSDRLKSVFLANMSHEIRTPMNSIIGFSRLLKRDLEPEKKVDYIEIIDENGKYLLKLIDDIIDISRIESENIQVVKGSCNIYKLFQKLNTSFTQVIRRHEKNEVKLSFSYVRPEFTIETDGVRLEQILTNLIMNAIKFTERGSIDVGVEEAGHALHFYVRDTGIGIKPEHLEEIFRQFFKLEDDTLKFIQRGTGIGLYLSRKLTELLGGRMWAESVYGRGSTFHFTVDGKEIPFRLTNEFKQIIYPETLDWKMKTLLIAEDEDTNFILLEEILIPTNIVVYRAKNGREAVDMCHSTNHFNLVLMDIKMPEMDGYQAFTAIREHLPSLPVIALTALAMEGDKEKCLAAGFNDYITKPIDEELLLLKLSIFLE
jgi:signal transduction histidine kinase/CheY-like chemotaxis protein